MAVSSEGAIGVWFFMSIDSVPISPTPDRMLRVVSNFLGQTIANVRYLFVSSTASGPTLIVTEATYDIELTYPAPVSGNIVVTSRNPFLDPSLGLATNAGPPTFASLPRNDWAGPFRLAIVYKCSTFTGTYAADGYVQVWMNDTKILDSGVTTIPVQIDETGITVSYGLHGDMDRVWGRTTASLPLTNTEGAFTAASPADLLYFEEFTNGVYPDWTVISTGAGGTGTPNSLSDCGGDDDWGLSAYAASPTVGGGGGLNRQYSGIQRVIILPTVEPPDPNLSGIYYVNPGKTTGNHDSYYGSVEKKIPNPTIRTALLGE